MTNEEALRMAYSKRKNSAGEERDFLNTIIQALERKPKIGHWITSGEYYTGAYGSIDYVNCSCCHIDSLEEGDYCPNCGAKMEE